MATPEELRNVSDYIEESKKELEAERQAVVREKLTEEQAERLNSDVDQVRGALLDLIGSVEDPTEILSMISLFSNALHARIHSENLRGQTDLVEAALGGATAVMTAEPTLTFRAHGVRMIRSLEQRYSGIVQPEK